MGRGGGGCEPVCILEYIQFWDQYNQRINTRTTENTQAFFLRNIFNDKKYLNQITNKERGGRINQHEGQTPFFCRQIIIKRDNSSQQLPLDENKHPKQ